MKIEAELLRNSNRKKIKAVIFFFLNIEIQDQKIADVLKK